MPHSAAEGENIYSKAGNTGCRGDISAFPAGKEKQMTTKELLYVDDALAHCRTLATQFDNAADELRDASLRVQVRQMADRHREIYRQFYNLV